MLTTLFLKPKQNELHQYIRIDLQSPITGQLFRKSAEYATRHNNQDALHKRAILDFLLKKGSIDILSTVSNVTLLLKSDFDISLFEKAWLVIHAYINEPKTLSGGTGLPR